MKTCSIINFWDADELLPYVVRNISPLVEGVIIVFSDSSNYSDYRNNTAFLDCKEYDHCFIYRCEPLSSLAPVDNERRKRNFGLEKAKELGFTHFLDMDADECYDAETFLNEKQRFLNSDLNGLCCACEVFFKKPTLSAGIDKTIVPFIQKITPGLRHTFNRNYPYAFIDGGIRIDPTRQTSQTRGVEWSSIIMKHYSYIRKDIQVKIRNSTARNNIERSTILEDLANAAPGVFCKFYNKTLTECKNPFNIPEF